MYPGDGSGSGLLLASGSASADDGPQGSSQVAALTKAAGSVLDRVARAALAKLPESECVAQGCQWWYREALVTRACRTAVHEARC